MVLSKKEFRTFLYKLSARMSFFQVYTQLIICKVNPKVVNKGLYDQFYMKEISCMECEGDCPVYRVHMDHGMFDLLNL